MEHLRKLIDHMGWADERVIAALQAAEPVPQPILTIFAHVLAAEHVWQARLAGKKPELPVWPELSLAQCVELAARNAAALRDFVATLSPADLGRPVHYLNSAGQEFSTAVEDILLQVALHGSYHRGQIAAALRQHDRVPSPTDYIQFIRGVPAATRRS